MYESFEVRNFRCFEHFAIDGLRRVNLIAGVNNVGKTALLEALFLHSGAYNPVLTLNLTALRLGREQFILEVGPAAEPPWSNIFAGYDTSKTVELTGKMQSVGLRTVRLRVIRRAAGIIRDWRIGATQENGVMGAAVPLGVTDVLELEHEEGTAKNRYDMVLKMDGPDIQPTPPAPPYRTFFHTDRARTSPAQDKRQRDGRSSWAAFHTRWGRGVGLGGTRHEATTVSRFQWWFLSPLLQVGEFLRRDG